MHYPNIIFYLEGTLTDPRENIAPSLQHALAKLANDEPDLKAVEHVIGPLLLHSYHFY